LEKGAEVDFNHESRDPTVSLMKFEQSVKNVKNLILICGKVGPPWLIGRIKKAFKAISEQFEFENRSSLEHIWLFLAPRSAGWPDLPSFPPLIHIDILDNSQSDQHRPPDHRATPCRRSGAMNRNICRAKPICRSASL